jgi:hypothetical protein
MCCCRAPQLEVCPNQLVRSRSLDAPDLLQGVSRVRAAGASLDDADPLDAELAAEKEEARRRRSAKLAGFEELKVGALGFSIWDCGDGRLLSGCWCVRRHMYRQRRLQLPAPCGTTKSLITVTLHRAFLACEPVMQDNRILTCSSQCAAGRQGRCGRQPPLLLLRLGGGRGLAALEARGAVRPLTLRPAADPALFYGGLSTLGEAGSKIPACFPLTVTAREVQ